MALDPPHSSHRWRLRSRLFKLLVAAGPGHGDPEHDIGEEAGQPAGHKQEEEEQAKPPGADAEIGAQTATNAADDAVLSAQNTLAHDELLLLRPIAAPYRCALSLRPI